MNAPIGLPPRYFSQNLWAPEGRDASMSGFCENRHSACRL